MLTARRTSVWRRRWEIDRDGQPVASIEGSGLRGGARLEHAGHAYDVVPARMGTRWTGREGDRVLAEVERPGRARWTVTDGERTWTGRRTSFWRREQAIYDGDREVARIRRVRALAPEASLDPAGLPEPVAVFVLAVVVLVAQRNASAGAAAGAAGSG